MTTLEPWDLDPYATVRVDSTKEAKEKLRGYGRRDDVRIIIKRHGLKPNVVMTGTAGDLLKLLGKSSKK